MNLKESMTTNPTIAKINDGFYKAKPTIFVVLGMAGTAASVFLAWRAGRKTKETVEEIKNDISEVKEKRPTEIVDGPTGKVTYAVGENQLTKAEYNKALCKAYLTAGIKLGKIFAPAVITEVASLTSIGYGYGILNDRFVATAQACQAYAAFLATYRDRVKNAIGEEKERQLYYGTHEETVDEPDIDKNGEVKLTKDGKPKLHKTKKEVLDAELAKHSIYARVFDPEYCTQFQIDEETNEEDVAYNGKWIRDSEKLFNNKIRYNGYHIITMNDIYDHFGFKYTGYGQVMGWHCKIDPKTKEPIFDIGDPDGIKFVLFPVWYHDDKTGALKKSYIIDFNVAGNILGYYDT